MELNEKLNQFITRLEAIKDSIQTEEATKTSMIMPFFQLLGYDVFNPMEFVPEYTADVGIKKGEKIDYAILVDGEPLIFIECKAYGENLDKHNSQLFRYFAATLSAKFGILTDGVTYKFYTDLEEKNRMDDTPFLTFNLLNLQDRDISEIKRFTREVLDVDNILNSAENLKYSNLIKNWFAQEIENPSVEFTKLVLSNIYEGTKNQKAVEKFTPLIKRALQQYINDTMNAKIKSALNKDGDSDSNYDDSDEVTSHEKKINTTIEEIESFAIIKSILRHEIDCNRITYRDTESYLGILLDDNNRKWICRVHLNGGNKFITISDDNKNAVRYDISELDDIYNYSIEIVQALKKYL
nr:MAG TPA: hypothetical protein [Bacteriophage sp.]